MLSSTGHVRRIIEEDGKTLVSFEGHSPYFYVAADVAEALRQAQAAGFVVHFTYDTDLKISGVVAHED